MGCLRNAALLATLLAAQVGTGRAQAVDEHYVTAQNRVVPAFGYGTVTGVFTTLAGRTGDAWCQAAVNRASRCLSVSGGLSCALPAQSGVLVSCNQTGKAVVNETPFSPVNCHGNQNGDGGASGELTNQDWCGWGSYMATRTTDTLYQYNDYVRVGVNKRFGGTVLELYGTDRMDRIMQAPGGAMQLALYGDDLNYAPAGTPSGWFASNADPQGNWNLPYAAGWDNTPYPTQAACSAAHPAATCKQEMAADNVADDIHVVGCASDGQDAGGGFNPVMGVSTACWYGDPSNVVDSVSSPAPGTIAVSKNGPNNYSKSSNVPGLTWTLTSKVIGPFAQLTYDIVGDATLRTMTPDFQELPAVFPHGGIGALIYYYKGPKPYASLADPVEGASLAVGATSILAFPPRTGPYGTGKDVAMTEDWASMCDTTGTRCLTVASFSNDSQIIQATNGTNNDSYFGVHGFFTLQPGLKRRVTLFIAPYRYDDIVQGQSVRQWIYELHQNPMLPPALD